MFDSKKTQLFGIEKKASGFLQKGMEASSKVSSGNNALKYNSTQNPFVDQFAKAGSYKKPRTFAEVSHDMQVLWGINKIDALKFIGYLRLITRNVNYKNSDIGVHRGAGLKNEAIMRMLWVSINYPHFFFRNAPEFIAAGSWQDIIKMLQLDLIYHGWDKKLLDWELMVELLMAGLENPQTSELVKKYLPQIKAKSKCKTVESQADTLIGKFICNKLFGAKENGSTYKRYRKLKVSGTAHQWQQLISQGKHNLIDFNTVHGRALSLLVSSDYIKNQGLTEKYQKWIEQKPVAKFTGYVHELAAKILPKNVKYQNDTINAQFNQLLQVAGKTKTNLIVVKDTSESMNSLAFGTNMSSYSIAKALSIFLAKLLDGSFANHYIDFSSKAILRQIYGSNFVENWNTEKRVASANTNFLGVAELLNNIKNDGVSENEFPSGIVCISDGEFDRTNMYNKTNLQAFRDLLLNGGFSKQFVKDFKIVFWDIRNSFYGSKYANTKFESNSIEPNVFYFGGYDPSVIHFLTGKELTNSNQVFEEAINQPLLNMIH